MRVLAVLCLIFAFVAAQEDGGVSTTAPDTIIGCIHKTIKGGIDASKENFKTFLEKLSPTEDISGVLSQVAAEYDLLQQKLDETTKTILADRDACEENNKQSVFKRRCDLLAKLSFLPKGARHVAVLIKNCISIVTKAHLSFAKGGALSVIEFLRDQGMSQVNNLRDGMACIQSRN